VAEKGHSTCDTNEIFETSSFSLGEAQENFAQHAARQTLPPSTTITIDAEVDEYPQSSSTSSLPQHSSKNGQRSSGNDVDVTGRLPVYGGGPRVKSRAPRNVQEVSNSRFGALF
jgi:hypothetical protein